MHFEITKSTLNRRKHHILMVCANSLLNDARVLKTAGTIRKSGYRVTLIGLQTVPIGSSCEKVYGYPFEIFRLTNPAWRLKEEGKWSIDTKDYFTFIAEFSRSITEFSEDKDFSCIYTHDMYGLAVGANLVKSFLFKGLPWIHDVHEYVEGLTDIPSTVHEFVIGIERENIDKPNHIVTVSDTLSEKIRLTYSLKKISIVYNAPRLGDFDVHYSDIKSDCGYDVESKLITYHGGVKPIRGVDKLIKAIAMLPYEYKGAIISNAKGKYFDSLVKLAKKVAPDRIQFKPYVSAHKVSSYIRSSSACVHTIEKYPNSEVALPNKLFESLHAGVPFICPPLESMSNFVRLNRNGVISNDFSHESLAAAILDIEYNNEFIRKNLNDYDLKKRYSWEASESIIIRDILDPLLDICRSEQSGLGDDCMAEIAADMKVSHLPAHSAGQPMALSLALRDFGFQSSSASIKSPNVFEYKSDVTIRGYKMVKNLISDGPERKRLLNEFLGINNTIFHSNILHYHALSLWHNSDFNMPFVLGDLQILRENNRKVYFHFRGSEARLPSVFNEHNKYSWFNEITSLPEGSEQRAQLEKQCPKLFGEESQKVFISRAKSYSTEVFVTDPEIDSYVGNATIIPRIVDKALFDRGMGKVYKSEFTLTSPMRVVHAPSRPFIKGTSYVELAVEALRKDGLNVELVLVQNKPNHEARQVFESCDLLIDQLKIGWYGVLSVECMALGVPVMCYIRDDLWHYLPSPEMLFNVNPESLESMLRAVYANPRLLEVIGKRGYSYAVDMHHPDAVARFLAGIYLDAWAPTKLDDDINRIQEFHQWLNGTMKSIDRESCDENGRRSESYLFLNALRFDACKDYKSAAACYRTFIESRSVNNLRIMYSEARLRFLSSRG